MLLMVCLVTVAEVAVLLSSDDSLQILKLCQKNIPSVELLNRVYIRLDVLSVVKTKRKSRLSEVGVSWISTVSFFCSNMTSRQDPPAYACIVYVFLKNVRLTLTVVVPVVPAVKKIEIFLIQAFFIVSKNTFFSLTTNRWF